MKYTIKELAQHEDNRGSLVELIRSDEVGAFNQVYTATIKPNESRGGHYHHNRREWFCVIKGRCVYSMNDVITGEKQDIAVSGDKPTQIGIEPMIWHKIINIGNEDATFVSVISDLYDKNNPDTFK